MRRIVSLAARVLFFLALGITPRCTTAVDYTWNTATGDFSTAASWDPVGVPGQFDNALFSSDNTNTVFTSNAVIGAAIITGAGVHWTVSSGQPAFTVTVAVDGGSLLVDGGLVFGGSLTVVTSNTGSPGVFRVSGTGTQYVSASSIFVAPFAGEKGRLTYEGGATGTIFDTENVYLGRDAGGGLSGAVGTLEVKSSAAVTSASSTVWVGGGGGQGNLTVDGGSFEQLDHGVGAPALKIGLGNGSNANSTVSIAGGGSYTVASTGTTTLQYLGRLSIAGGSSFSSGDIDAHATAGPAISFGTGGGTIHVTGASGLLMTGGWMSSLGNGEAINITGKLQLGPTFDANNDPIHNFTVNTGSSISASSMAVDFTTLSGDANAVHVGANGTFKVGSLVAGSVDFTTHSFTVSNGMQATIYGSSSFQDLDGIKIGGAGGAGTLTVKSNGTLTLGGTLDVGSNGHLNSENGAIVDLGSVTQINVSGGAAVSLPADATPPASSVGISVSGGSSSLNLPLSIVSDTTVAATTGGHLNVDSLTMQSTSQLTTTGAGSQVNAANGLTIDSPTATVSDGASLSGGTFTQIGTVFNGTTALTVDDAAFDGGSTGTSIGRASGSHASATFKNGATGTFGATLTTAVLFDSEATVTIESGSQLTAGTVDISGEPGFFFIPPSGTANLTVTGTGSSLSPIGSDMPVVVGHYPNGNPFFTPDPPATLNILNGGSVDTGTGNTFVGSTGTVTVDGGTLSTTNLYVNPGGTLVLNAGGDLHFSLMNVNGAVSGTGELAIPTGATLSGSGTIGVTVNSDGTLSAGNSAGTLTINSALVLNSASTLAFDLTGADQTVGGGINDLITGITDLTLGGTVDVTETEADSFYQSAHDGDKWRLLEYTGHLIDNGLALGSVPALASGLSYAIETSIPGQVNLMVFSAVPEANGFLLVGLIACGAAVTVVVRRQLAKAQASQADA